MPAILPASTLTSSASDSQVTLSWTSITGADKYNVYGGTSPISSAPSGTPIYSDTQTSFSHESLSNGDTYYYRVIAVDVIGSEEVLGIISTQVSAKPMPPILPASTLTSAASDSQVNLSWTSITGADKYNVYASTTPLSSAPSSTPIYSDTQTSFSHASLSNGETYYYRVIAVDVIGSESEEVFGVISTQVSAKPMPPILPASTLTSSASDSQVTLSWTSITGANKYNVYGGTSPISSAPSGTPIYSNSQTSFSHDSLSNGETYYYRVRAVDVIGSESEEVLGVISTQVSAKPMPPILHASTLTSSASDSQVSLSWTSITGAEKYNVYASTSPIGAAPSGTPIYSNSQTSFSHASLSNGETYYYRVRAVDVIGSESEEVLGVISTQVSAKPMPAILPASTLTSTASDSQVSLSWTGITGADKYYLYWSTSPITASSPSITIASGSTTSYSHTSLTNSTTYYYQIVAVDVVGSEEVLGIISTQVLAKPMPAPLPASTLTSTASDSQINLSWASISGADKYYLYWGTSPITTNSTSITIASGTDTTYSHTSLTNGTSYYYKIVAVDIVGSEEVIGGTSSEVTAKPMPAPLPAPTLTSTASDSQVSLSWTSISGAEKYYLYWGTSTITATSSYTVIASGTITTYSHTSLNNETTYHYKIVAIDIIGSEEVLGIFSTEITAKPNSAPPEITILQAREIQLLSGVKTIFKF